VKIDRLLDLINNILNLKGGRSMPTSLTQIFLSYPIEDEKQAYDLYQRLGEAGFKPWMFSQNLQPGASTVTGPEQALRQSDLFLALLSIQSTGRKGIYEKEWQIALEVWKERGAGIFIIPVRLEECKVPNALKEFQAVDLFVEVWAKYCKIWAISPVRKPSMSERCASTKPPSGLTTRR
jgi:hypothetical protein